MASKRKAGFWLVKESVIGLIGVEDRGEKVGNGAILKDGEIPFPPSACFETRFWGAADTSR